MKNEAKVPKELKISAVIIIAGLAPAVIASIFNPGPSLVNLIILLFGIVMMIVGLLYFIYGILGIEMRWFTKTMKRKNQSNESLQIKSSNP